MTLSTESAERIALLYRAAKRNGSLMTVQELSRLLPQSVSESDVKEAIASFPYLNSMFELRAGYLTERPGAPESDPVVAEASSRKLAQANLGEASRFVRFLHSSGFQIVAVSGSTSYGSASVSRDTDLFCVTSPQGMWLSLAKGLIMARAYGLVHRGGARICLSCVMDEEYARSTFEGRRHPLFARDAIEAKVLKGRDRYESLMGMASWISDYYPVAYREIVRSGRPPTPRRTRSSFAGAVNRLLFLTVGRYIRAKSSLINREFSRRGRSGDVFGVRSGEDHLIYESRRYLDLASEYEAADRRGRRSPVISQSRT
jgi:hypothetical protein